MDGGEDFEARCKSPIGIDSTEISLNHEYKIITLEYNTTVITSKNNHRQSAPLLLDELQCLLPRHDVNTAGLVPETNSIAFLGHMKHLGAECGANELPVCRVGDGLEHLRHSCPILRIEIGIYFIKEIEWRGIACLDGKDQGKSAETCYHVSLIAATTRQVAYSSGLH